MMWTTTCLAVVASLLFSVPAMAAVQLFDGRQAAMFRGTNFTTACGTALNTTLNCPATVKYLTYPDHAIGAYAGSGLRVNGGMGANADQSLEQYHARQPLLDGMRCFNGHPRG